MLIFIHILEENQKSWISKRITGQGKYEPSVTWTVFDTEEIRDSCEREKVDNHFKDPLTISIQRK